MELWVKIALALEDRVEEEGDEGGREERESREEAGREKLGGRVVTGRRNRQCRCAKPGVEAKAGGESSCSPWLQSYFLCPNSISVND